MASKAGAVLAALKIALEANYDGTVYRPDAVQVLLFWPDENALDASLGTIYLIRPGEERGGPGPESCTVQEQLEVFILAAHRFDSPTDNPFKEDPARWAVSLDLAADVKEKLRKDEKLAGQVVTVFVGPTGGQVTVDHERYLPRWVCPELRILIRYRYEKTER